MLYIQPLFIALHLLTLAGKIKIAFAILCVLIIPVLVESRWRLRVDHEMSTSRECHVTTLLMVLSRRVEALGNDEPNAGMQLLASVRYFLSSSLPQDRQDDLQQVLDSNGATPAATLKAVTHIITNSHRFEGSGEVEAGVHVVTVCVTCF